MLQLVGLIIAATVCPRGQAFGDRWVEQPVGLDGGSPGQLDCVVRGSNYSVHVTAYQRLGGGTVPKNLCGELPDIGRSYFAIDFISPDKSIRQQPIAVKVVEPSGDGVTGSIRRTLYEAAPQAYRTGVAEFELDFDRRGQYALIVAISNPGGQSDVVSFPLEVGQGVFGRFGLLGLMVTFSVIAAVCGLITYRLTTQPRSTISAATASADRGNVLALPKRH
jgi:hypothetical protein